MSQSQTLDAPRNVEGALLLTLGAFVFALMIVIVKHLGAAIHPFQLGFFRMLVALLVIAPFLIRAGRAAGGIRSAVPRWQFFRGVVGSSAMLLNFYAFVHLPLADAQAIGFSRGLFVVPLAGLILGELIGWRRALAAGIGFGGVLIILRPDFGNGLEGGLAGGVALDFNAGVAAALSGAFLVACATILVKIVSRHDRPVTLMFYTNVVGMGVALVPTLYVWQWPNLAQWGWILAMGVLSAVAHNLFIRAYAIGEASVITPFDYSRLIFAGLAGYVVWGVLPDGYTLLGAVIITVSALYIVRRESAHTPPHPA